MTELSERADRVQTRSVGPEEGNMLKIATHGRLTSLDLRLLGRDPEATGSRQIVFGDLGTPASRGGSISGSSSGPGRAGRWNAYNELKTLLIARCLPAVGRHVG